MYICIGKYAKVSFKSCPFFPKMSYVCVSMQYAISKCTKATNEKQLGKKREDNENSNESERRI